MDLISNSFSNYGMSFLQKQNMHEEQEYIFEYESKEDKNWKYTLTYYFPVNELCIVKEHKFSKTPQWHCVFDGVIQQLDDLKHIKRLVLV